MRFAVKTRTAAFAAALSLAAAPGFTATDPDMSADAAEVRAEISEAMAAIGAYTAEQRDEALAAAEEAMAEADAEIEKIDAALRDGWADMTDEARENATVALRELREARNALSVRYGALQSDAGTAWDELKDGFAGAWNSFAAAWERLWAAAFNEGQEAAEDVETSVQ